MAERENTGRIPVPASEPGAPETTGAMASDALFPSNEELLSGTGSIPLVASSTGAMARELFEEEAAQDGSVGGDAFVAASAPVAPRYVRQRTPHRSQGSLDDLADDSQDAGNYTHDSNISVGGATPLSGMAYRRSRSNMSRVKNGSRYGQYLEIPKGRRTIFASRERARRRKSVLALLAVVTLLALAAMFIWNMMQQVLG